MAETMEAPSNLIAVAVAIAVVALSLAILALRQSRRKASSPRVPEPYEMPLEKDGSKTLRLLVNRLDQPTRRALEGAAGLAQRRTHYYLDLEHWLAKIFQSPGPRLKQVFSENEALIERIESELSRALSSFPKGNPSIPEISTGVMEPLDESCVVEKNQSVRSCHLLLALLTDASLSARIGKTVPSLAELPMEDLRASVNEPERELMDEESERELHDEFGTEM